jgi:quinol monooxygenase YgiN
MPRIDPSGQYATFINTFRCRPEDQDEVVRINIEIVEQVASRHNGFVSAAVHRSTDGTRVINYLQWRSADDLHAMQISAPFQRLAAGFAGLIEFDPHEVTVAHTNERGSPKRQ